MTDQPPSPSPSDGPNVNNLWNALKVLKRLKPKTKGKLFKLYGPNGSVLAAETQTVDAPDVVCPVCSAVVATVPVAASKLGEHAPKVQVCAECSEQLARGYTAVICRLDGRYGWLLLGGEAAGKIWTVSREKMDAVEKRAKELEKAAAGAAGADTEGPK